MMTSSPASCSADPPANFHCRETQLPCTITLEVFAPQKEYLLLSRDLLRQWWEGA